MRWVPLIFALLILTHCSSMSGYNNPDADSRSSLMGDEGGAGVQAPIWSNDPSKKTITNSNAGGN